MNRMPCELCGQRIPINAVKCPACGHIVRKEAPMEDKKESKSSQEEKRTVLAIDLSKVQTDNQPDYKESNAWLAIAVLVIVASLAVLAIVYWNVEPDASGIIQQGIEYHERGEYEEAVKCFAEGAKQGDGIAQNELGMCYLHGEGVAKDPAEAVKWFRKSAEQGNMAAQYNLGICYEWGKGVHKNKDEALNWFKKAAAKGHTKSLYKLGWSYEHGDGVPQDKAEALYWYEKAYEQGHKDALKGMQRLKFRK